MAEWNSRRARSGRMTRGVPRADVDTSAQSDVATGESSGARSHRRSRAPDARRASMDRDGCS